MRHTECSFGLKFCTVQHKISPKIWWRTPNKSKSQKDSRLGTGQVEVWIVDCGVSPTSTAQSAELYIPLQIQCPTSQRKHCTSHRCSIKTLFVMIKLITCWSHFDRGLTLSVPNERKYIMGKSWKPQELHQSNTFYGGRSQRLHCFSEDRRCWPLKVTTMSCTEIGRRYSIPEYLNR